MEADRVAALMQNLSRLRSAGGMTAITLEDSDEWLSDWPPSSTSDDPVLTQLLLPVQRDYDWAIADIPPFKTGERRKRSTSIASSLGSQRPTPIGPWLL